MGGLKKKKIETEKNAKTGFICRAICVVCVCVSRVRPLRAGFV